MTNWVLFLGGASNIAHATARHYARTGANIGLIGRNETQLKRVADDLNARGATQTAIFLVDLSEVREETFTEWTTTLGDIDTIVIAYGTLGRQTEAEADIPAQHDILTTNFVSAAGWMNIAARYLATRGEGTIALFGSVAGDRARRSNYIYGAAKAALHFYAEGLRLNGNKDKLRVVIVKPGQTRTQMTQDLDTSGPLWSDVDKVGADAYRAICGGKRTTYSPWFWRWIMRIIRVLPYPIFRRTNF